MSNVFLLIFLISPVALVFGLIKPSLFQKIFRKVPTRKAIALVFSGVFLASFIGLGITSPKIDTAKEEKGAQVAIEATASAVQKQMKQEVEQREPPPTPKVADQIPPALEEKSDISPVVPIVAESTSSALQPPQAQQITDTYLVTRVVDGDTFDVLINGKTERIRSIGMDTPETVDPRKPVQCFGKEASKKTTELLLNKKVRLEADPTQGERDKYNRLLRYTHREDGLFFNKWMIENGYAHEYTYNILYKYQPEFKEAQRVAREKQFGLWAPDVCASPTTPQPTNDSSALQPITGGASDGHTWYTSSHHTGRFYYCDTDLQWQNLSTKYLQTFTSEAELLKKYQRTLHEPCK